MGVITYQLCTWGDCGRIYEDGETIGHIQLSNQPEKLKGFLDRLVALTAPPEPPAWLQFVHRYPGSPMRQFEIWAEGHASTGSSSGARLFGTETGVDLKDAAQKLAQKDPEFASHFDPRSMTYWGCKLFDNEGDARRAFG